MTCRSHGRVLSTGLLVFFFFFLIPFRTTHLWDRFTNITHQSRECTKGLSIGHSYRYIFNWVFLSSNDSSLSKANQEICSDSMWKFWANHVYVPLIHSYLQFLHCRHWQSMCINSQTCVHVCTHTNNSFHCSISLLLLQNPGWIIQNLIQIHRKIDHIFASFISITPLTWESMNTLVM